MDKEQLFEFHIRSNWFKISRFYNQMAAQYDISFSWGFIMLNVEKKGTPSTALGPRMGMEPTSLSRTLKNMEDKGYIIRKSDADDKRKSIVFLTDTGLEMRTKVRDVVIDFNKKLFGVLPKTKVDAFFDIMQRINFQLDELLNERSKEL